METSYGTAEAVPFQNLQNFCATAKAAPFQTRSEASFSAGSEAGFVGEPQLRLPTTPTQARPAWVEDTGEAAFPPIPRS